MFILSQRKESIMNLIDTTKGVIETQVESGIAEEVISIIVRGYMKVEDLRIRVKNAINHVHVQDLDRDRVDRKTVRDAVRVKRIRIRVKNRISHDLDQIQDPDHVLLNDLKRDQEYESFSLNV